jgi:hypothetical protein
VTTNPKRSLAADLEKEVRRILADPNAASADKLKALEIGCKLVLAKHKTEGSDKNDDFFGK